MRWRRPAPSGRNFLNFRPGLVSGGHCIGVDPYYLTHKAEALGYRPEVILAGRRINDSMGGLVARELVKAMIQRGSVVKDSRVLIMGLAFKENTPDLRNSRVIDIIRELAEYEVQVDIWDPWISGEQARHEYGLEFHRGAPSRRPMTPSSWPSGHNEQFCEALGAERTFAPWASPARCCST